MAAMQFSLPPLIDQHGRTKRKLRVSLTDRCNFRCSYCLPEKPIWLPKASLLSNPERLRLLQLLVSGLGIQELRLTGGEPLMRPDLAELAASFAPLPGLKKLALTTNGHGLAPRAAGLKAAGISSVNVSLDAVTAEGFARMTGGRGSLASVQAGALAAQAAGMATKLNAVVIRGQNEQEILPLARWAFAQQLPLRLIEFMPLDDGHEWAHSKVVPEAEMLAALAPAFSITAEPETNDPARYYLLDGQFKLGIISTISRPFCTRCDRLRLTANGQLFTCLFSAKGVDLLSPLRAGASDAQLIALIRDAVWHKPSGYAATGYVERPLTMHALGG